MIKSTMHDTACVCRDREPAKEKVIDIETTIKAGEQVRHDYRAPSSARRLETIDD